MTSVKASDNNSSVNTDSTGVDQHTVQRVSLPVLDEMTFAHRDGGGYDRDEVDEFLGNLSAVFKASENERTALRADVAQLKDALGGRSYADVAVDAVGLLSQAQLIADETIADAQQYARDLVMTARTQYHDVLKRAEASAGQTVASLPRPAVPVPEVEYVRTYAKVAQVQLRAVLDALAAQVDLLGQLPNIDQSAASEPDVSGEVSFEPHKGS